MPLPVEAQRHRRLQQEFLKLEEENIKLRRDIALLITNFKLLVNTVDGTYKEFSKVRKQLLVKYPADVTDLSPSQYDKYKKWALNNLKKRTTVDA